MLKTNRLTILRSILLITLVLGSAALYQLGLLAARYGLYPPWAERLSPRAWLFWLAFLASLLGLLLVVGILIGTWTDRREKIFYTLGILFGYLQRLGRWNLLLFFFGIGLYAVIMLSPYGRFLRDSALRWLPFWLLSLAGTVWLKAAGLDRSWSESFLGALLISAAGYRLSIFTLDISISPFSLGWSEASRYYYASLYLSKRLYGESISPTVLHPSRYLLQAFPFLFTNTPIWIHRTWQVLLWLASIFTTAGLLARRFAIADRYQRWLFILWLFLFLIMPPVYYHLLVTVILVLWGYNKEKPWQTFTIVLIASAWAGISRINWWPVPGMIAATIYFLEEGLNERPLIRYLSKPVMWIGFGTLMAFLAQTAYISLSGNPSEQYSSSFTSDLLWYRLLPSATFSLGILPAIILVSTPLFLIIFNRLQRNWSNYHPIRYLGIMAMLAALFAGGLVVSVKIGGGSNLHNLDAYLTLLLIISTYAYLNRIIPDNDVASIQTQISPVILVITILVPIYFAINLSGWRNLPDRTLVQEALITIQEAVNATSINDNEILFISERQLLMFEDIQGTRLIPDYEKVFLMEMAMANNTNYLNALYDDLKNQRFSLIISEPLKIVYQDRSNAFGEENNAWVERVVKPILCYYEPITTLRKVRVELLAPRLEPGDCQ